MTDGPLSIIDGWSLYMDRFWVLVAKVDGYQGHVALT